MISPIQVASVYLKQAEDPCNAGSISAAWISPDGETHMIPSHQVHADWAEEYLVFLGADPKFDRRRYNPQNWLLEQGWVRVSNFLNIEVAARYPSEKAMQATVDMVVGCVHQRKSKRDLEKSLMFLGWGSATHKITVADFVQEWGGKKAEERLFEKMASLCDPDDTSAAWVSPEGTVHMLTSQSHDAWAYASLMKNDPEYIALDKAYQTPVAWAWLLQRGWVRVSNFLNLEIGAKLPSAAAMQAIAELVADCASHNHTDPETTLYLGMLHSTRREPQTKRMHLADFIHQWGGKKAEERLFEKMAKNMCDPGEVSAAWVSPKGEVFRLNDWEYHDKWAEEYLEKDEKYQKEWEDEWMPPGQFLVEQGWVRIHNYLNIDTSKHLPSNAAMKSTVEVVMGCALSDTGVSPRVPFYVGMGDSTKQMRLSDFLHQWGGRSDEDKFFSTRKTARDLCNPGGTSSAWVSPDGEVHLIADSSYHDEWARAYLKGNTEYEDAWIPAWKWLVQQGWVRVANFLDIEVSTKLPSDKAMQATARLVVDCATRRSDVEPETILYLGMGEHTKHIHLADFIHQWGGKVEEERLFSTRVASMTRYVPLFVPLGERVFPVSQKPTAVWWWQAGVPTEQSRPIGMRNALFEHEGHDWKWANGTFRYSGVGHTHDGWLLLQYGAGDDTKQCSSCGKDIPEAAKFCPMCGVKMASSRRVADAWLARQATKTPSEREDEEAERLIRKSPKQRPPRDDSRRELMDTEPKEPKDKDLSMNYKDVGG